MKGHNVNFKLMYAFIKSKSIRGDWWETNLLRLERRMIHDEMKRRNKNETNGN